MGEKDFNKKLEHKAKFKKAKKEKKEKKDKEK